MFKFPKNCSKCSKKVFDDEDFPDQDLTWAEIERFILCDDCSDIYKSLSDQSKKDFLSHVIKDK